jgi:hypothetical protein
VQLRALCDNDLANAADAGPQSVSRTKRRQANEGGRRQPGARAFSAARAPPPDGPGSRTARRSGEPGGPAKRGGPPEMPRQTELTFPPHPYLRFRRTGFRDCSLRPLARSFSRLLVFLIFLIFFDFPCHLSAPIP